MLLLVASSAAASTILIGIGKYDVLTVLGGFMLVLSRSMWAAAVGALIMTSGNPEQALLAAGALVLLSLAPEARLFRSRALVVLGIAAASWLTVQWWFHANDMANSRLELVPYYLGASVGGFLSAPDLAVWNWLGSGWIVVLVAVALLGRRSRWIVGIAVVAIPGLASVITADGARVAATVALPSYLAIGLWLVRHRIARSAYSRAAAGALVVALIVLPTAIPQSGWWAGQIAGRVQGLLGG